jgi:hypothetical protein
MIVRMFKFQKYLNLLTAITMLFYIVFTLVAGVPFNQYLAYFLAGLYTVTQARIYYKYIEVEKTLDKVLDILIKETEKLPDAEVIDFKKEDKE